MIVHNNKTRTRRTKRPHEEEEGTWAAHYSTTKSLVQPNPPRKSPLPTRNENNQEPPSVASRDIPSNYCHVRPCTMPRNQACQCPQSTAAIFYRSIEKRTTDYATTTNDTPCELRGIITCDCVPIRAPQTPTQHKPVTVDALSDTSTNHYYKTKRKQKRHTHSHATSTPYHTTNTK